MKHALMRRAFATLLLAAFIFSTLPFINMDHSSVHAADTPSTAYHDITVATHTVYNAVRDSLSLSLTDFDDSDNLESLLTADQGATVTAATQLNSYPFSPFSGQRCALISVPEPKNRKTVNLTYQTEGQLDAGCRFLFFAINLFGDGLDSAAISITLESTQRKITYDTVISSGDWSGVFVPLDRFEDPSQVTRMRIGVTMPQTNDESSDFRFAVDTIAASSAHHPEHVLTFLSDDFYCYGNSIAYTEENNPVLTLTFHPSTAAPFIESYGLAKTALTDANAIRLTVNNASNCTSVSLYYTTDSATEFTSSNSSTLPLDNTNGKQTLDFYLGDQNINQFRIVFNGASEGTLTITSVTPVSGVYPYQSGYGQISSCRLTGDGDTVTVRGSLSADALEEFARGSIRLYVLSPWEDEHTVSFASLSELRQIPVGDAFTFSVPRLDAATDRLCSKFAVVIVSGNQYHLLDDAKYITNPEMLAAEETALITPSTQKGIIDVERDYLYMNALQYGITQTVVDLSLSDLFSASDPGYRYVFEDKTYYFNHNTIAALDLSISRAYRENIAVYLRLRMTQSSITERNDAPQSAFSPFESYGFSVNDERSLAYLRAVASFLAERYATNNGSEALISGMILGDLVDRAYQNYYLGQMSLRSFVTQYETAYRVFYNTMRSISPALSIYISLSGQWDHGLPTVGALCYDAHAVLDGFAARIALGGQIGWNLAFHPNTQGDFMHITETAVQDDTVIGAANLETLCESYADHFTSVSTSNHSILLLSDTPVSMLRYAYTLLKLSSPACSAVTGYIVTSDLIWENEEEYSALDTKAALASLSVLLNDPETEDWKTLIPSLAETNIPKRTADTAVTALDADYELKGSYLFADFSSAESFDGWKAGYACASIRTGEGYLGNTDTLFASMRTADYPYASIQCDFPYPRDLSVSPCLRFSAYIVMLPEGVHEVRMTVILQDGADYISADYILNGGTWNQIIFDASSFENIDHIRSMRIQISSANGESIGDPTLILTGIRAYSDTHTSDELAAFVTLEKERYTPATASENTLKPFLLRISIFVLAGAALLELIHIFVRLLYQRKKTDAQ